MTAGATSSFVAGLSSADVHIPSFKSLSQMHYARPKTETALAILVWRAVTSHLLESATRLSRPEARFLAALLGEQISGHNSSTIPFVAAKVS